MGQYTKVTKIDEELFAVLEKRDREKFPAAGDYLNYLLSAKNPDSFYDERLKESMDGKEEMSPLKKTEGREQEKTGRINDSQAEMEQLKQMCMLLERTVSQQEIIIEKMKIVLYELKWNNKFLDKQFYNLWLCLPVPRNDPLAEDENTDEMDLHKPWRLENGKLVEEKF